MKSVLYFTRKLHAYAGKILYINLCGMMLVSLLDGVGVLLLVPLLTLSGALGGSSTMRIPLLSKLFEPVQIWPRSLGLLAVLGIYLLIIIGQNALKRNLSLRDVRLHTGFINHLRLELYRGILSANWEFFVRRRKSDLLNALIDELSRVANGTKLFTQFLASFITTGVQLAVAFYLSPRMTVLVVGCGAACLILSRRFVKHANRLGKQTSLLSQNYLSGLNEQLGGIKDIKSNRLESSRYRWLLQWSDAIANERYERFKLSANSQMFYKAIFAVLLAAIVYVSLMAFHLQGQQFLLVMVVFSRIWPQVIAIQTNLEQIAGAVPAFTALTDLQQAAESSREIAGGVLQPVHEKLAIQESLECRKIRYRYQPTTANYAVRDITLSIPANRTTAIVGPSGAGKTTLVDILTGLLRPEAGEVRIDGIVLSESNLLAYRQIVGYVPQDPFLFHASIRENLNLFNPDASETQLWEALSFAAADDFVRSLPEGLDTQLGDRGVRLSGGERQRLVLARAILRKPSILVLDEATSALDTENEAKIREAIDRLKGRMTILIIAHRLSTIRHADQVIVMDKGQIVEHGNFDQLATGNGLFQYLLGCQFQYSALKTYA